MIAVLAVLAVLAVPAIQQAQVRAKSASESENLRIIEAAKSQFSRANPGKHISSVTDLAPYLPDGQLPESPWGITYANVTDLDVAVTSPANGDPSMEPAVEPLDSNGFNDILIADRVYYKRPGVDPLINSGGPPPVDCNFVADVVTNPTGPASGQCPKTADGEVGCICVPELDPDGNQVLTNRTLVGPVMVNGVETCWWSDTLSWVDQCSTEPPPCDPADSSTWQPPLILDPLLPGLEDCPRTVAGEEGCTCEPTAIPIYIRYLREYKL